MASEVGSSASSEDVTPVPAIALAQSQNELLLPPNNCPNCKVLSRHLKISREWNNFFRLKLDQRDMLLHVAADYKRQKQRCLQLQMSLDQQSRECGEMREQLTNLLLEVNPLKERVAVAEQNAKEEMMRREKAESDEYNLRFLVDQQAHKIRSFDKVTPNLLEMSEKKLSTCRAEIKKLKQDIVHKSRAEWELKEEAALTHAKHQRTLKKAHWGLSLAHRYGRQLMSLGELVERESSHEWVHLESILEEAEHELHKQYLAHCQQVAVRPLKEVWLHDFDEWQENEGGGEDTRAKQLEKLIQNHSVEVISIKKEEQTGQERKMEKNFGEGNQQHSVKPDGTSNYKATALEEPNCLMEDEVLCSSTRRKEDLPKLLTTSVPEALAENSVSHLMHKSFHSIEGTAPHAVDTGSSKDGRILTKPTSILDTSVEDNENDLILNSGGSKTEKAPTKLPSLLDTSAEDNESDPIPCVGGSKDGKLLTESTSILDTSAADETEPIPSTADNKDGKVFTKSSTSPSTSAEDSKRNSVPRDGDIAGETPNAANTGKNTYNNSELTSTVIATTKGTKTYSVSSAGETGHHKPSTAVVMDTQELSKQRSLMDTSTEDSDEEILPESQNVDINISSQTLQMGNKKDAGESPQDTDIKNSENDCSADKPASKNSENDCSADKPASTVTSYHLDEELQAILQKMKPHEKLEDMDASSLHSSEEHSYAAKTDVLNPYKKQNSLSSLSDSEEEKQSAETPSTEDENGDEISMPPRILTTQMSEGFSVASSLRESSLQDDLDLSTDTLDPDDDEEKKEIQKRVLMHFPSTQSFSCDFKEWVPPPDSQENLALMLGKADNVNDISERQQVSRQPQLQHPVDTRDENTDDSQKLQNKAKLREEEIFGARNDFAKPAARRPVDTQDKDRHVEEEVEEEEEGGSEDEGNKIYQQVTAPEGQHETGTWTESNVETMKECIVKRLDETLENVSEATPKGDENREQEGKEVPEGEAQSTSVFEEQRNSEEEGKRNMEEGIKNITETTGAGEEHHKEAEQKIATNGREERNTVVEECTVEAIIEEGAAENVEKIPLEGQVRMSESVADVLVEKEEGTVVAVVGNNSKMVEDKTSGNSEEERITEAVTGRTTDVMDKLPSIEQEGNDEVMKEKTTCSNNKDRFTDIVQEKYYGKDENRTTESVDSILTEGKEHKTVSVENVPVIMPDMTITCLQEGGTNPADERTIEDETTLAVEENIADKQISNEPIQKITEHAVKEDNVNEEINTQATEDKTLVTGNICIKKESFIEVADMGKSDTLELEPRDDVEETRMESVELRTAYAAEDEGTEAIEESTDESAKGTTCIAVENKHTAVLEERTTATVIERNLDVPQGKGSKNTEERADKTAEEQILKVLGGKSLKVMAERLLITGAESKNAKVETEENTGLEGKNTIEEEESSPGSKKDKVQPAKRMTRRSALLQEEGKVEEGEEDEQEECPWKRRLRRQKNVEWESQEMNRDEKGRRLRGCVLRRMADQAKLEQERKAGKQRTRKRTESKDTEEKEKKMELEEKNTHRRTISGRKLEVREVEGDSKKQKRGRKPQQQDTRKEMAKREKVQKHETEIKTPEFEGGKKRRGRVSKKQKRGRKPQQQDTRKEMAKREKVQKHETEVKTPELEGGKKRRGRVSRTAVEENIKPQDENVTQQDEEEMNDENEAKGETCREKMKQEEEDKVKEVEENREEKREIAKEERQENTNEEEKEEHKEQENERKQELGKRIKGKKSLVQEEEQRERKEEGRGFCMQDVEEENKFLLNQGEEKKKGEEESHRKAITSGGTANGLLEEGRFPDTNKEQKRIIFSWSSKRTERRKLTKFSKWGKLTRVIPDPLGALRHSVFARECHIQPNEEQQGNTEVKMTEQPRTEPQGPHEEEVMCCKGTNIGKERFGQTDAAEVESVAGGRMNKINSVNKKTSIEINEISNEKALEIGSSRKRNTSSSSDDGMALCSSRELQSRNRAPRQIFAHSRNAKASWSGGKRSHNRVGRRPKSKISKVSLLGLDSSNSSEVEEKKTRVKKSRKFNFEDKEQQQLQSLASQRPKRSRQSVLFGSVVSENKKATEQVQVSRTRELSSSSSCSISASHLTNDSGEESITEKRSSIQSSQETHSEASSESDIPKRPFTRKHKASLILSDSDELDDSFSSATSRRKKQRKRKVMMSNSNVSEESDCSNESDNSSSGKKRLVTHHITPQPSSARARTHTEMQRKGVTESCKNTCNPPSATQGITPHIPQGIPSIILRGKQTKDFSPNKICKVVPGKFTRHHSVSQKHQIQQEAIPCSDPKSSASRESALPSQSLNQSARRLGHQIMKEGARTPRNSRPAEATTSTPIHTSKRKHTVLLLEAPPPFLKRRKGSSSPFSHVPKEHRVDASNTRGTSHDRDGVGGHKIGSPVLSASERDSAMPADKKDPRPRSENVPQVSSDSKDQDQNISLSQSDSEEEPELVVDEDRDNSTSTDASCLSSPPHVASVKTQDLVKRMSHLGPVAFIDRPRFKPKPAPQQKVAPQVPVSAGPKYVDRLFSKLNQRIGTCSEVYQRSETDSFDPTQETRSAESHKNSSSQAEGTSSQSQPHFTRPARVVDYQGQHPVLLPNIYGTLGPAPGAPGTSASPDICLVGSEPNSCQPPQPTSSLIPSTCEQAKTRQSSATLGHPHSIQDCPRPTPDQLQPPPSQLYSTSLKPSPTLGQLQPTPGHPQHPHVKPVTEPSHPTATPGQPHTAPGQLIPGQPSLHLVPEPHTEQVLWLPEIVTKRRRKEQEGQTPIADEDLKETLEEVVASRIHSRWWVTGLRKICASITSTTLPSFLRLVLESILRSDPLEPLQLEDSLPPRLYRLFQVVCVVEQRLTPQHPNSLRTALLRAIQAIVTQPDIRIRPQSLACLTAWYVASASIDNNQPVADKEWGRGRAFLVDLLFHHPGTAHLAILTAANTCSRLFLKHVPYRGLSGLEHVLVWLSHYGAWVGRPRVRSDLTKWLVQHLNIKKPPQSPATLAKLLVALLGPGNNKDQQWAAVVGIVVLTRWQGRTWAQKQLLPVLVAAATKITVTDSQEEDTGRGDLVLHEDLKNKNSHLFGTLGRALPRGPEETETGDIVKKMEDAVSTLLRAPTSDLSTKTVHPDPQQCSHQIVTSHQPSSS